MNKFNTFINISIEQLVPVYGINERFIKCIDSKFDDIINKLTAVAFTINAPDQMGLHKLLLDIKHELGEVKMIAHDRAAAFLVLAERIEEQLKDLKTLEDAPQMPNLP